MSRVAELADEAMRGSGCEGEGEAVFNAILTYGEEVRKKAAQECRGMEGRTIYLESDGSLYKLLATTIEKMDLP